MLTIADIPDEYRKGQTDGENILRLASGVQEAIGDSVGDDGLDALKRFVQAGFLFRSGEIGRTMIRSWNRPTRFSRRVSDLPPHGNHQ